ncbi:MAG: DUF255 domain-containing protein [Bacteroidota bacterium]
MKIVSFLACIIPLFVIGQISFESSWEIALAKSKQTEKPIFLNASAEWCEPCKEMADYTFTDLEVANFFNKNFINVTMDMEDYPGVELAERYTVSVFPSFLFIDRNENILHRSCGAVDASEFLRLGKEALVDSLTFQHFEEQYRRGERDVDFMMDYLALLEDACLDAERFAENYLENVGLENLSHETSWEIFAAYQWNIFSPEFQYLLENKGVFERSLDPKIVNAKIYDTYLAQYQEVFEAEELHDFGMSALLYAIEDVTFTGSDTLKVMMNLHYAEFKENWEAYADHAIELVGMTGENDPEQLNELAWKFYLFVEDKNQLKIASSWAKQSVDQLPEPSVIDTYASLQYKLGEKRQAIELGKQALELAKELYEDTSHFEYQLKKFEEK